MALTKNLSLQADSGHDRGILLLCHPGIHAAEAPPPPAPLAGVEGCAQEAHVSCLLCFGQQMKVQNLYVIAND